MGEEKKIDLSVGNYYGSPYVYFNKEENKYYIAIDDYKDIDKAEISKAFYNSCKREFNNRRTQHGRCNKL